MKYYGDGGFLFPFDIRYAPDDRAFCDLLPDGRVRFRLWTQPVFAEAVLVYNDGQPRRCQWREPPKIVVSPTGKRPSGPLRAITYSFALKTFDGRPVYWCQHGIDHSVESLDRYRLDLARRGRSTRRTGSRAP